MIFISAGHHPASPGAKFSDRATGVEYVEHDEAKIWASLIAHHLGSAAIVVPTGHLRSKVAFINERAEPRSLAIEVHFNAAVLDGVNVGKGSETLYYPGSTAGEALAEAVQDVLAIHFPPSRGIREGWYRENRQNGPDFFLAHTKPPAVILEPEFIHRLGLARERREVVCKSLATALWEFASA